MQQRSIRTFSSPALELFLLLPGAMVVALPALFLVLEHDIWDEARQQLVPPTAGLASSLMPDGLPPSWVRKTQPDPQNEDQEEDNGSDVNL